MGVEGIGSTSGSHKVMRGAWERKIKGGKLKDDSLLRKFWQLNCYKRVQTFKFIIGQGAGNSQKEKKKNGPQFWGPSKANLRKWSALTFAPLRFSQEPTQAGPGPHFNP